jgi:adenosylcobinamide-GDP ribazoletransferase
MFFTRLPLWRIYQPPQDAYNSVVEYWPLTGWLTGGAMAATLYFGSYYFPLPIAIILAIVMRLLLTGALHEDGLADFFDGFGGGGRDRQRVLDIMKDSHIGTYGVIVIVIYVALLFFTLLSMQPDHAAFTILMSDPYAKMLASQTIQMMPYARTAATAKNGTVYRKFGIPAGICLSFQGLTPLAVYVYLFHETVDWQLLLFIPCITMYLLYLFIWHRLKGYTGDCCGAMFLMVELSVYIVISAN